MSLYETNLSFVQTFIIKVPINWVDIICSSDFDPLRF